MRTLALVSLVLASAGCGFSFERSSEVLDRRIIAMQAEPPEIIVDPTTPAQVVRVRALVADPKEPGGLAQYEWRGCSFASEATYDYETSRCREDASTLLESGAKPLPELAVDVAVPAELLQQVQLIGSAGQAVSLFVNGQLRVDSEAGPLYGFKRITLSPPLPAGRVANRNPRLVGVLFDGEPWDAGTPKTLKFGACAEKASGVDPANPGVLTSACEHAITPVFDAAELEHFQAQTFDQQLVELDERLRFHWFVDAGAFSRQSTATPAKFDVEERDPVTTKWREPAKRVDKATLWVVVQDGRGGESWEKREIAFEPQ